LPQPCLRGTGALRFFALDRLPGLAAGPLRSTSFAGITLTKPSPVTSLRPCLAADQISPSGAAQRNEELLKLVISIPPSGAHGRPKRSSGGTSPFMTHFSFAALTFLLLLKNVQKAMAADDGLEVALPLGAGNR
jgi:hypothetical protein